MRTWTAGILLALTLGLALPAVADEPTPTPAPYTLKGEEMEACECTVSCPCVWQKETTYEQCRAMLAWCVTEGNHGKTDLKGMTFALVLLRSGKDIEKAMGHWEGVLYITDKATAEQKQAIVEILRGKFGKAFAHLDVSSAPVEMKYEGERHELTIPKIATVKIVALKGANGKVPAIENPPSPVVAIPKLYCAQAEVNTYDDGAIQWDFAGRNAFYGPFEYANNP